MRYAVMVAAAIMVSGCVGGEAEDSDLVDAEVQIENARGAKAPPSAPKCSAPGRFTCEDSYAFAYAGFCPDLVAICGSAPRAPKDFPVNNPCAPYRFMVSPYNEASDCVPSGHDPVCGGAWETYCCTLDGSSFPLNQ